MGELTLTTVDVDDPLLDDVIRLGDANKKSLGFLPWAGFTEAAHRGGILAALSSDDELAGYCLFDVPSNYVRITHLCVSSSHRGRNVARQLIEAVSAAHQTRLGLRLKCRPDWAADKMWPRLGFAPTAQVTGRSKAGHPLTIWWLSHGHDDLLSMLLEQNHGRRVAVDANVYSDLHARSRRRGSHHSAALAPLIADQQIKVIVCASVRDELYATPSHQQRERFLSALVHYEQPPPGGSRAKVIADDLLDSLASGTVEKDPSLKADALFLAEAVCADVDVAVSRDENAVIQFADYILDRYDITVVNPAEIRSVLDAAESPGEYLPAQLRNTGYTTSRPQPQQWRYDNMAAFLDQRGKERKATFVELLRTTASESTQTCDRWLVLSPDNEPRAAWVTRVEGTTLRVLLLRVAGDTIGPTIARHLTFHLRQEASESGCSTIEILDEHCGPLVSAELEADGYHQHGSTWTANVVASIGRWDQLGVADELRGGLLPPTEELAEIERVSWPLRLLGAGIPNYLVPIRGNLAADLLGYPTTLDSRPDFLGLSREHVYYKAPGIHLTAPGRVLWFASRNPQDVFACSRLVETITGYPNNLHRRFSRFGVYDEAAVRSISRRGRVEVLRFADTEIFRRPVNLDHLRRLARAHSKGPKLVLRSASAVDDELFEMIYREGTGR